MWKVADKLGHVQAARVRLVETLTLTGHGSGSYVVGELAQALRSAMGDETVFRMLPHAAASQEAS